MKCIKPRYEEVDEPIVYNNGFLLKRLKARGLI
jgi:hypothetical protein